MLFGNGKLFLCLLTLVLLFLQTFKFLIHMHYLAFLAAHPGKQSSLSISLLEVTITSLTAPTAFTASGSVLSAVQF